MWLKQELIATSKHWLLAHCNLKGKLPGISHQPFSLQEWQIFKSPESICLLVTNTALISFLTGHSDVFSNTDGSIGENFYNNQGAEV